MTSGIKESAAGAAAGGGERGRRRVLIADPQTILREGLQALLAQAPGLEVAGAVDSGAEAVRLAGALKPDVVLLDMSLGDSDGLGALREIKRRSPSSCVLVLTVQDSEEHVWAALQAGADGYVLKEASRAELLMAIDSVLGGRRFISPAVSSQIVSRYLQRGRRDASGAAPPQLDSLTAREKQVMKLVAEGRRNREIAQHLYISVKTVEKHRSNLMHKLKLHNIAALTSLALEKGLLGAKPPPPPAAD